MTHISKTIIAAVITGSFFTTSSALAMTNYVFGSIGYASQSDSDNSGAFSDDFLTGEGTTIPINTALPAGTPVGWTTKFDNSAAYSIGIGHRYGDNIRLELEVSFLSNDADTHYGVQAAGIDLSDEDAAVLISGATNIGATVDAVVDAGRGDVSSTSLMFNGLYDFTTEGALTPFVGLGLGWSMVDVTYRPSGVGIINDDDSVFSYQLIGGASYAISENGELYGAYKYRQSNDVEVQASLFPATLDVENPHSIFEIGYRLNF